LERGGGIKLSSLSPHPISLSMKEENGFLPPIQIVYFFLCPSYFLLLLEEIKSNDRPTFGIRNS
jgi:hypothetical protein